jgi:hypothetical protein
MTHMKKPRSEEELFHAAAQRTGPERSTSLERECGSNSAVRARLETLLSADGPYFSGTECAL